MSLRLEPDDPAEARDEVRAPDGEAVDAEVGEAGIAGGLVVAGEETAAKRRVVVAADRAGEGEPRAGERVAVLAAGGDEQERAARVALEVAGVEGEVGEQHHRFARGRGRHRHQRGEGAAIIGVERAEAAGRGAAEHVPGGRGGRERGVGHLRSR